MLCPSSIASEHRRRSSSIAFRSPFPPSLTLKRIGSVIDRKPREPGPPASERTFSSSAFRSTGVGSSKWSAALGVGSRRFSSGPIAVSTAMTIASRSASTGGFVTWAKSCLK